MKSNPEPRRGGTGARGGGSREVVGAVHRALPFLVTVCGLLALSASGCSVVPRLASDTRGSGQGRIYYLGGAGPLGNVVGAVDIPAGLREAGYRGSVEVVGWQSVLGGTLRDQVDRERNEEQARDLARRIRAYQRRYPGRPVHIIALSAGTGITTWALERFPPHTSVETVVFLGSSLSRSYDMREALAHVNGSVHNFYSPEDPVLRYMVPIAGPVDRSESGDSVAGLLGFRLPQGADEQTQRLYDTRLQNMPYRKKYADYGVRGLHADWTTKDFVRHVVGPLLLKPARGRAVPQPAEQPPATQSVVEEP